MARRGTRPQEDAPSPATPSPALHPKATGQLLLSATSAGPTETPDSPSDVWASDWAGNKPPFQDGDKSDRSSGGSPLNGVVP